MSSKENQKAFFPKIKKDIKEKMALYAKNIKLYKHSDLLANLQGALLQSHIENIVLSFSRKESDLSSIQAKKNNIVGEKRESSFTDEKKILNDFGESINVFSKKKEKIQEIISQFKTKNTPIMQEENSPSQLLSRAILEVNANSYSYPSIERVHAEHELNSAQKERVKERNVRDVLFEERSIIREENLVQNSRVESESLSNYSSFTNDKRDRANNWEEGYDYSGLVDSIYSSVVQK